MELTMYLAQVFGLYLILAGVIILIRRSYFAHVVLKIVEDRLARMLLGAMELAAGIFLVTSHNDWSSTPATIVSLIGWLLLGEGLAYLSLSDASLKKHLKKWSRPQYYYIGGVASIIVGCYLLAYAMGYVI